MNEHWSDYWRELRRYTRFLPIGPPLSLLPLLFSYERWSEEGRLMTGVIVSLCYGVTIPLTNMAMFAAVYAVLTLIAVRTGRFYNRPLIFFIMVTTVATVAGIWLSQIVKSMVLGGPVEGGAFLTSLIFGGLLIVLFSLYLVYRQAKEEALSLRAAVAESRYNALEHQMRPHFLFNALNSLAELIESRNERAAEMTYTLSDLYRQILVNSKLKTAPLESEIEIARQYLELEKVRFGSRLTYSIKVAGEAERLFVPSLMIQTLVENAVKHGVSKSLAGGHITVELCSRAGGLYGLKVTNTGEPFSGNGDEGTGLANTRARLGLLYGDRHHFHIGRDEEGRTVASFQFSGEKID